MHSYQNNLEKSYTEKKDSLSGYSLFTNCSFDATKNKPDCFKGKNCMERFCKNLREHAMKIINYEKKERIPLTNEENEYYEMQKVCYICKKGLILIKIMKIHLNYFIKSDIIVIIQEDLEELLITFAI